MAKEKIRVNIKKQPQKIGAKINSDSNKKLNIKIETPERKIIEDIVEIIDGGTF